ncbi:twin-arginine translocase TatA/TatE family subunit [Microbacterium sp. ZXX196]|uniref:twin-arginine translocase TatA/TatE family subunit n=1 Tax=Microbacterium sp. ZXX196 TaxID=2609291 RepID=UPI0012B9981B|nr:twin-arginine translocase TatA/TatE family subunit [Microbacterium sp. ZXX196]MTE22882.1 Sec-independent protein translocase TatB [Microbacterium sp. ZXX196]
MFNGFAIEKIIIIAVIAAIVIGPERLPQAAEWLARAVRRTKEYVQSARTRVESEMGEDFSEVDWQKLDPRQYDPRRIIREALLEDDAPASARPAAVIAPPRTDPLVATVFSSEEPPPFDDEAT